MLGTKLSPYVHVAIAILSRLPNSHFLLLLESCFVFVSAMWACYGVMLLELSKLFVFVFETGSYVAHGGPELLIFHLPDAGIIICATVPGFIQF